MSNFLVFAGTSEGRTLIETLAERGASVCACVATEYGRTLLPAQVKVFAERLDAEEMTTMLETLRFDCVIDATHPYASLVTENIKAACAASDTHYLRVTRPESQTEGCVYAETASRAAELLTATTGRVLLTTGSKELDLFTQVPDYQSRLCPRVLPALESIERCLELGYRVQNIVAMQGPFSREMNGAMMRQMGASILVTKESGDAGGFLEKLGAAQDVGATAIVIGRPREDRGYTPEESLELLCADFGLSREQEDKGAGKAPVFFPLFQNLSGSKIGIFGGGTVAARRAAALLPFCGRVIVIAPQFDPALEALDIPLIQRPYLHGDCAGLDMALAATDSREINRTIYEEAKAAGIPVNVSDAPEECDFYFPAVIQRDSVVIGVTASGADHHLAKAVAKNIRAQLDNLLPRQEEPDGKA